MTLGRGSSASGQLARLGFTEPALAAAALESGALGPLLDHEQVLLDLAATADPDAALHALVALLTAADDPALVTALHEDARLRWSRERSARCSTTSRCCSTWRPRLTPTPPCTPWRRC